MNALGLIEIYKTREPREIADKMGVKIATEALGKVKMYYLVVDGVGVIHINDNIPWYARRYQIALGLYYHLKSVEGFGVHLKKSIYDWDKHEKEAHEFATDLTVDPEYFAKFSTFRELCAGYGMNEKETHALSEWLRVVLAENDMGWDETPEALEKFINEIARR